MLARIPTPIRTLAVLISMVSLLAAAPQTAVAAENIWGDWARDVVDRENKIEIPFAILATLPAMFILTPFWLGTVAIEAATGGD